MSRPADPTAWLQGLAAARPGRLRHVERLPGRTARAGEWPEWLAPTVLAAFADQGVTSPWSHQRTAMDLAHDGTHTVLATGTASGKSLGYLAPMLTDVVEGLAASTGRGATALYLAPTKALAADQLARLDALALPGVRAATYDGDTSAEERRWVRRHAQVVLTNPDLLHHSLLPGHEHWRAFLRALRWVIVDECHVYRGVLGSHVACVVRRLRRLAARYGARPTFVLASATVSEPAAHASRLIGMPCVAVTEDGSPRATLTIALWEPGQGRNARRSAVSESAELLAHLVDDGIQTLAFARSRAGAEALARSAERLLQERRSPVSGAVAAYRGGYLPEDRRALEHALRVGKLRGLAATNSLELGVDICGLDAVLIAGWPGRRASLFQQAGRAGRAGREALAVLVAADDPLDTFLMAHPAAIFGAPMEATVIDPGNPYVLAPHLVAAADEVPLVEADVELFGDEARSVIDELVATKTLRRRPSGWYRTSPSSLGTHVSLRTAGTAVAIVDERTGRILGTIDSAAAPAHVHTGAVHVHQGETWVVTDLDLASGTARAVRGDPGWTTTAQSESRFEILATERHRVRDSLDVGFGRVRVATQVTGFIRRLPSGEVIGRHPLDLPEQFLDTRAVWWAFAEELLGGAGILAASVPGAAHAAEHAAIGLLPVVATSDRWDIGGVSTAFHPDTGRPTVMVYDGYSGGAGFAERGYAAFETWLQASAEAIEVCPCESGCPACVQSPKCGNGNEPLDKRLGAALLRATLRGLSPVGAG